MSGQLYPLAEFEHAQAGLSEVVHFGRDEDLDPDPAVLLGEQLAELVDPVALVLDQSGASYQGFANEKTTSAEYIYIYIFFFKERGLAGSVTLLKKHSFLSKCARVFA